MNKIAEKKPYTLKETETMTDGQYHDWAVKEITEAKQWADDNPDKMISEREVWKALGFEY
ncbi:MAG: hypothetical protein WA958_11570 [Tunicatimonas sp.]